MRTKILTLTLFFGIGIVLFAQDNRFEQGNEYYSQSEYEKAIEMYQSILQSGLESAAVYYNLGNAFYKSGKLPEAILNYERALLLSPQDNDIRYNLELAYEQTADKIDKIELFFLTKWFTSIRNLNDSDGWAIYSIVTFIIFLIGAGFYLFGKNSGTKKVAFSAAIIFLLSTITFYGFSSYQKDKLVNRTHAIIFTPTVNIKSSPDQSGTNLFVLHQGTKVELISKLGEWWNIRLEDGNEGWIHESDIEII
ncbi:tetratricopeptide repeat protein [Thermophagus xiamenensis]|nr:tetratricopeptide repeat protein [Thermophagus xiamenensis]